LTQIIESLGCGIVLLQTFKGARQVSPISFMAPQIFLFSDVHLTKKLTLDFVQKVAIHPARPAVINFNISAFAHQEVDDWASRAFHRSSVR
jgi:hypothetical protein